MEAASYKQYPVHPALRSWVRYFWSYDVYTPTVHLLHIRSFADRYPRLIFQDINSASLITEADGNRKPVCYLSGIDTAPTDTYWDSRFSHFGVSFYPHALHAIFGINAAGLTDQTPDIHLFDKLAFIDLLHASATHETRVDLLQKYFYEKIRTVKQDPIIEHMLRNKLTDTLYGEITLATLADSYHISERQLQRRFRHSVGVSASKFSRIARFERSLKALSVASYGNLTDIAYEMNYTDQAHFIHDFKKFSGISPYEFVRNKNLGSESASFIYLD
jgi:AraC-type DNA-binding domain-containing proteins